MSLVETNRKIKSKKYLQVQIIVLPLHPQLRNQWSIRLSVRTPDFHSGKRGSIPLWTTIQINFIIKNKD